MSERRVEGERVPLEPKAAADEAKEAWGRYDDDIVLVVLRPGERQYWTGGANGPGAARLN